MELNLGELMWLIVSKLI